MAPRPKRIPESVLRRYLAKETTLSALAAEVGMTRQGLSKRLASLPVQKRLAALDFGTQKPTQTPKGSRRGKPSSPPPPVADHEQLNEPEQVERRGIVSDGGTRTTFQYAGKGRARIGYGPARSGSSVLDLVAAEHAGRLRASKPPRVFLIDPSERADYEARGYVVSG